MTETNKKSGKYMESDGDIPQEEFNKLQEDVRVYIEKAMSALAVMLYKSKQSKSYFAFGAETKYGDLCVVIRKSKVDPDVMCPCCSAVRRVDFLMTTTENPTLPQSNSHTLED